MGCTGFRQRKFPEVSELIYATHVFNTVNIILRKEAFWKASALRKSQRIGGYGAISNDIVTEQFWWCWKSICLSVHLVRKWLSKLHSCQSVLCGATWDAPNLFFLKLFQRRLAVRKWFTGSGNSFGGEQNEQLRWDIHCVRSHDTNSCTHQKHIYGWWLRFPFSVFAVRKHYVSNIVEFDPRFKKKKWRKNILFI